MGEELPEGWIAHHGGPMPVEASMFVNVMLCTTHGPRIAQQGAPASRWHWDIDPSRTGAIIAYKPEPSHDRS